MNKYKRIGIFVVLVGLMMFRFVYVLRRPMYLDEGIYMSWAESMNRSRDNAYISLSDGKTPLFYWTMSLFGPMVGNYLLSGRLVSIVSGLLTGLCWATIFYLCFSIKKSVVFLLLFLISPYGFFIERLALSDSMMLCFASISLLFIIIFKKCIDNKTKLNINIIFVIFSGIFLGLAYAIKTSAKLFFVSYILIFFWWLVDYFVRKKDIKRFLIMFLGLIVFIGFYSEVINYFRVGGHILWNSVSEKESLMVYAPRDVIEKLINNPLNIFSYSNLISQYIIFYLSGVIVFFIFGIYSLIKIENNRKFLWLILYLFFAYFGIALSGKVMASRYIYSIYPVFIAIAVFGFDLLWSFKNKKVRVLALILIMFVFLQSCLMVFRPEKSLYATDDKKYFVKSHLSALGLNQVIDYVKEIKDENIVVGVSGIWGIPEGSTILLSQSGIASETVNLKGAINENISINGECESGWNLIGDKCFKLNFSLDNNEKYFLYIVGNDELAEIIYQLNTKQIFKFVREEGGSSSYLFEIIN